MQKNVTLKITDKTRILDGIVKGLSGPHVLVGIPEDKAARKGGKINNAQLLYIHTNGSPLKNIPKRPVIEPAIEARDHKEVITGYIRDAMKAYLDGDKAKMKKCLSMAGQAGENFSRDWFDDPRNNWPENALSTIRAKLRKIRNLNSGNYKFAAGRKAARQRMEAQLQAYYEGAEGINTVLVDTEQMRKAITHVVMTK